MDQMANLKIFPLQNRLQVMCGFEQKPRRYNDVNDAELRGNRAPNFDPCPAAEHSVHAKRVLARLAAKKESPPQHTWKLKPGIRLDSFGCTLSFLCLLAWKSL